MNKKIIIGIIITVIIAAIGSVLIVVVFNAKKNDTGSINEVANVKSNKKYEKAEDLPKYNNYKTYVKTHGLNE